MPLSEDEQRILRQIEEQLQRDPGFGRNLHPQHGGNRRMLVGSAVAAVIGLVFTVALLGVSPLLSFVAFIGAVVAAVICERHARVLSANGLSQLGESMRGRFPRPGQSGPQRHDD